jgi:hypothetical protein
MQPLSRQPGPSFRTPWPAARSPLRQTTNTFSTITLPQPKPRPIEIKHDVKTPSAKRLGPSSAPASGRKRQRPFITPFKDPQTARALRSQTPVKIVQSQHDPVVFDLRSGFDLVVYLITESSRRKTMREAYLKPGYNSVEELEEMGM